MNNIKLTQLSRTAGCAAKMAPGELSRVLAQLPKRSDKNLLVGFDESDDACIYKISDTQALVQTVDFFPPVVDDAFLFGQIAAANALSDVYAMGGQPFLAMNLMCFPACISTDIAGQIMAGGLSKVHEAGAIVAGGHSIYDDEPKYGLCVTGKVQTDKIWHNGGVAQGDALILTKALGVGVLNTALTAGFITTDEHEPALKSMITLNKYAAEIAASFNVHACTDVTGFGLLGHGCEMAKASGTSLEINSDALQFLPLAKDMAKNGLLPAGAYRNAEFFGADAFYSKSVKRHIVDLTADPQTSGGLLFALPQGDAQEFLQALKKVCTNAAIIGEGIKKQNHQVLFI